MLKVRNLTSPRSGREVANQFVIENGDTTLFQSYRSPIVEVDRDALAIRVYEDWDYSRTTSKYRNQFFNEQGFPELVGADLGTMTEADVNGRTWAIVRMF